MDYESAEETRSKTSDASLHEPLLSPVRSSRRNSESDSKRKFRIMGLKHPGEWRQHEKLQEMLARCDQFHMWFDPNPKKGVKTGGVSLTFDCPEAARIAFTEAQKFVLDGTSVKLLASRSFYDTPRRPMHSFTVSEDASLRDRTLYAIYLLESTSADVLENIFGKENMEKVEIMHLADNKKQAEVVMTTKEAAEGAKSDGEGFELSDGVNSSVIKVFTPSEYMDFMTRTSRAPLLSPSISSSSVLPPLSRSSSNASNCSKPSISPVKTHQKEVEKTPAKPTPPAPVPLPTEIPDFEPSQDEVSASITSIVEEGRINWAEMNEKEELYRLADEASYKLGGVRDDLLRDSLLSVMEAARSKAAAEDASWMRRHLDELIKMWKKEIASGVSFDRPSRVPLQARIIKPLPKEKRKKGGGAAARANFGIGAVLAAARSKFATEEGELDIEEGDDGSILIGDVPLSFESWARFNKQPLKRAAPKEEKISNENSKENRRVKRAKMEEEKKKRKEEEKAKKEAEKPTKELEEGEMDSESDGGKKEASSSSSSSESDEEGDSRRRRRFRRKNDRTKPPSLPPLFQSIYDNRVSIINQLSIEHRVAFSKVLTQFVNQKGGIDSNQQKQLMSYMSSFR